MLWNYLQQITFHLHSSSTKYIVKTFVIFAAHLEMTRPLPGPATNPILAPFLSGWIARFWKYCLIHSRLRTMCVFFPSLSPRLIALCNETSTSKSKVRHPNESHRSDVKQRCVLWSRKDSTPLCQTETAICIKGQPTFNNDQLPSTPRGETGVTVIILTGKACYCITASFGKVLKMSRKPQK